MSSPLEYAEGVVAEITGDLVQRLGSILHVNKLEGDAAFGYALDGELGASMLLDTIEKCYFGFRRRLRAIEHSTNCSCNACAKAPGLDLKFVVHHGDFIRRAGSHGEELTGQHVILVHRLLKNTAAEVLGRRGYALCTEACVNALGIDPTALGMGMHEEHYDDVGAVRSWIVDLETRWEDERSRSPIFVTPEESAFSVEMMLPLPPTGAWDYLTSPEKRLLWQVDDIEQVDAGGRRCTGSSSVCVDGRTKIDEEILDWRPFDYFTERTSLPGGGNLVVSTELVAEGEGTRVRVRGRRPTGRRERAAWLLAGPRRVRMLRRAHARLADLLASEA